MKRITVIVFSALIIMISISAARILNSGVYEWQKLVPKKTASGFTREIFNNPTRSLDMFEMKAITLNPGQASKEYKVKSGSDVLLIIKEGSADISVNGKTNSLGEGSIVVASQGDIVTIKNSQKLPLTYFSFLFLPKNTSGITQNTKEVPTFYREWSSLGFIKSANGGRRDVIRQPTSSLKELEMHISTLNEGLPSHGAHTHPDEEIILVKSGTVEETISGKPFQLGPGSVIFVTNDDMHGIRNAGAGQCEYYAIRWLIN